MTSRFYTTWSRFHERSSHDFFRLTQWVYKLYRSKWTVDTWPSSTFFGKRCNLTMAQIASDDSCDTHLVLLGGRKPFTTRWLIPRIVSGLVHPSYLHGISGGNPLISLGWTNPLTKFNGLVAGENLHRFPIKYIYIYGVFLFQFFPFLPIRIFKWGDPPGRSNRLGMIPQTFVDPRNQQLSFSPLEISRMALQSQWIFQRCNCPAAKGR